MAPTYSRFEYLHNLTGVSKALKIAAIVVGVAAVVLTAGTALLGASAVAGFLGVSTATLATVTTVLSITATALSIAAGLAAPKPKFGDVAGSGTQLDFSALPTAGQPYAMGSLRIGESVVHEASWGDKNKFLGIVGVLSCAGPIFAYDGLYGDNTLVNFSGGAATGYYAGYLSHEVQLGQRPETGALSMSGMPDWGSDHKTSSLATSGLILQADVDTGKVWSGGVPQFTHQIRGVLAYDPRLDSTNGGSGSQRPGGAGAAETSYAYSENPWVHHGTYAIGRWVNGVRVIGPGLSATSIDWASHIEAANIADAHGWTISGRILTTDNKWDCLRSMAQAGGGYPIPTQAKLACLVNAPRVSLETVQETDVKGAVTVPQMAMRRDRLNGGQARYREPSLGWQVVDGAIIRNSTYLAEDGGRTRTKSFDLPMVANKDQAAQLVAYEVANSRERSPIRVPLDLYWSQYKTGDCITLNIPSALLFNQKCVIIGREIDAENGIVTFTLRTEDDAKHAWALGVTGGTPPSTTVSNPTGAGDVDQLTTAEITTLIQNSTEAGLTFSIADTGAVTISTHTRIYADKSVSVTGTGGTPHAVSGAAANDGIYIFYDDQPRNGGAVTYQHLRLAGNAGDASSAFPSAANPYRHFVCYGIVPASGSTTGGGSDPGSGGGGEGPCVTTDTLVQMAEGPDKPAGEIQRYMQIRTRPESADGIVSDHDGIYHVSHIEIVSDQEVYRVELDGKVVRATANHRIWVDGAWSTASELGTPDGRADVVKMTVADAHTYVSNGLVSHNMKPLG